MASLRDQETDTTSDFSSTNPAVSTPRFLDPSISSSKGSKSSSQQPLRPHRRVPELVFQDVPDDEASEGVFLDGKHVPDDHSENTAFTESTIVPRRDLGFLQVTALMLNGCLANGFFFTTPCYVLALIRSKRICLVLWAVGGVYSALGMAVFLELGAALPYNGGALIYLDELFHRPRLLATVIFSVWWILFASTAGASKSVAQTILSLATHRPASEIGLGWIKFTAVVVLTVVCLMLFFARRLCFAFNTISALYKIILMLAIFVAGMRASGQTGFSGFDDFNMEFPGYKSKEALTAMVYIIQAYGGWENANYVSGEVKNYKRTLKWAGIAAITILTCLNMLVTVAIFGVADYSKLTDDDGQSNSVLQFAETVFGTTRGMNIAAGLSAFMTLVFITYTTVKVKQAIAWQRIIPFSQFFGQQNIQFDTPGGALLLHWIFSVIPILCLGRMSSETRIFFTGIYGYGYELMFVFLGIGLLRLKSRMCVYDINWKPTYLTNSVVLIFVAVVTTVINVVVLVMTALPHDQGTTPRFYWAVAVVGIAAFAITYWAVIRLFQGGDSDNEQSWGKRTRSRIGFEVRIYEEGDENVPDDMKFPMYEALLDGSRRRLQYKVSGPLSWCFSGIHKLKNAFMRYLAY